jgi:tetratricopeptide (TPR) repeat protein
MPSSLVLDPQGFPRLDQQPLSLPPKERAVLALLLDRPGAVVHKEDFAARAWAGQAVQGAEALVDRGGGRQLTPADGGGRDTRGATSARGLLLDMAWRFDDASHAHRAALAQAPEDAQTRLAAARHHLMTGDADEAVVQLERVHTLAPHTPHLRTLMARAYAQAGRDAQALACARACVAERPGELFPVAFEMAIRALVAPDPALEADARRLADLPDPPPWAWTVLGYVLARLQRREAALDLIDAALLCSHTSVGEATLYAAPLAALGETARAATLLEHAFEESCGMLALVLRDPANAVLVAEGGAARRLMPRVFSRMPSTPERATAPAAAAR